MNKAKKIIAIIGLLLVFFSQETNWASVAFAQEATSSASSPSPTQSAINNLMLSDDASISATPAAQILSQTDSVDSLSSANNQSAILQQPAVIEPFHKKTFQFKDSVSFDIANAAQGTFTVRVLNSQGKDAAVGISQTITGESAHIDLTPPQSFHPGKYTVEVLQQGKIVSQQDFSWGVLAINTDQSTYTPNSTATIAMTVLDNMGNLVCNAQISLVVTDPTGKTTTLATSDNSIQKDSVCDEKIFTLTPDYVATYKIGENDGVYALNLSAVTDNGSFSISDSFVVNKTVPFILTRLSATRLYPDYTYPVTLSGVAQEDFSGQVTEVVPASFTISRITDNPTIQSYDTLTTANSTSIATVGAQLAMPFADSYPTISGFGEQITDSNLEEWYNKNGMVANDGMDFAMPSGTPILAVDNGTVVEATQNGPYGMTVAIQHTWGRSYYGYVSSFRVAVGDTVSKGETIALSGATGNVSQPEFHFAIRPTNSDARNGYFGKVDPAALLGLTNANVLAASIGPADQVITWNVTVAKGQKFQLGYQFKAPNISPQFYTLGPARFFNTSGNQIFAESRQWQLAFDSTTSYQMQTGYYVGNTNPVHITGLGFKPQLVIIKSDSNTAGAMFSTTLMPGPNTAFFIATADNTTGEVNLETDGFTVSSTMSTANIRYTWVAFTGSNCSATGMFCVGSYTGTGSGNQSITSVGFQPDLVWVKQSTAIAGNWRSSAMATNEGEYFAATTEDRTGVLFTTLDATGFTVGTTNNAAGNYYYVAFKSTAGSVAVGSYTGNGTSQSITGLGFSPNFVFAKNANDSTPQSAIYETTESYGDNSSLFTATANTTGAITSLDSNGFSVGSSATTNNSGNTIFYAAFDSAASLSSGSGTFTMAHGTYTGTGAYLRIGDLGFSPDLVMIKGNTTQYGVFRTSLMGGDSTAYFGLNSANFTGGITAFNPNGFTVGAGAQANTAGVTYYWVAYGNAWDPTSNSGASDFYIGAYYGNAKDNRNITRLPFQADMVVTKVTGQTAIFRTSAQVGDTSSFFNATVDIANDIQSINSDGFQVGTNVYVNAAAGTYFYFGFKTGSNFAVGTYTGTGSSQNITSVGFQPDAIWVKKSDTTAVEGVMRTSDGATDSGLPFINTASVTGAITGILTNGFTVNTAAETNTSGKTYWYVAWKDNSTPTTPTYHMQTGYFIGNTNPIQITGLGFTPQLVILKSDSNTLAAMFSTTLMPGPNTAYFIANADNATGWVNLEPDGFTVSGNQSTANIRVTWIAFAGANCSSSGVFCVGAYTGNGSATQAIASVGFQPDLVWVKPTTAVDGTWRSSSMATNVGQYFSATVQDTTGALFTTLDSTGFTVGSANNTNSANYYYVAFKNVSGSIKVGSYTGSGSQQSITGLGFSPDFVFMKNSNAAASVSAVMNQRESYGNLSSYFTKTADLTASIISLDSNGFTVGTDSTANGNTNTMYYAAFNGEAAHTSSGTFTMAHGAYVGTGAYQWITGLGFQPDLVIVKGDTAQAGVFRTSLMGGDSTAYLDSATANFTGGITAFNPNGFTVGTNAAVNTSGTTYYWTAYGNAWDPTTNSGASDFYVGAYYGNAVDNTNITRLPFQADMVTVKRSGATGGVFRTSTQSGDTSSYFAATNDAANNIQSLASDGFQLGTSANVNTAANIYWYFGFKNGPNFTVGSYSGTGASQGIASLGFSPANVWIKRSAGTATRGVERTSDHSGDYALPFINVASITGAISSLTPNGFTVGTAAETNASGATYWYAAWTQRGGSGATSPSLDMLLRHGEWFSNGLVQPFTF